MEKYGFAGTGYTAPGLIELSSELLSWQELFFQGVTFELSSSRIWVRFRGDPVGTWRSAQGCFVFETIDGQLSVVRTNEQVLNRTVRAVTEYLG